MEITKCNFLAIFLTWHKDVNFTLGDISSIINEPIIERSSCSLVEECCIVGWITIKGNRHSIIGCCRLRPLNVGVSTGSLGVHRGRAISNDWWDVVLSNTSCVKTRKLSLFSLSQMDLFKNVRVWRPVKNKWWSIGWWDGGGGGGGLGHCAPPPPQKKKKKKKKSNLGKFGQYSGKVRTTTLGKIGVEFGQRTGQDLFYIFLIWLS